MRFVDYLHKPFNDRALCEMISSDPNVRPHPRVVDTRDLMPFAQKGEHEHR
jgi:hypothetical protein